MWRVIGPDRRDASDAAGVRAAVGSDERHVFSRHEPLVSKPEAARLLGVDDGKVQQPTVADRRLQPPGGERGSVLEASDPALICMGAAGLEVQSRVGAQKGDDIIARGGIPLGDGRLASEIEADVAGLGGHFSFLQ